MAEHRTVIPGREHAWCVSCLQEPWTSYRCMRKPPISHKACGAETGHNRPLGSANWLMFKCHARGAPSSRCILLYLSSSPSLTRTTEVSCRAAWTNQRPTISYCRTYLVGTICTLKSTTGEPARASSSPCHLHSKDGHRDLEQSGDGRSSALAPPPLTALPPSQQQPMVTRIACNGDLPTTMSAPAAGASLRPHRHRRVRNPSDSGSPPTR